MTDPKLRSALSSAFADRLVGYIEYKQDLGYKATEAMRFAPCFDRFCREEHPGETRLDEEIALSWVRSSKGPDGRSRRASFMRELARYLIDEGEDAYVLPSKISPSRRARPAPHLFTKQELDAFFQVVDTMEPSRRSPARHLIAPVFFRLLYCCGLRPWEARELPVDCFDLDRGIIHIVNSKGSRDRDVPVHEDVRRLCLAYSEAMDSIFPERRHFFPNRSGRGFWSKDSAYYCFLQCWQAAGLAGLPGPDPVLYSFRHTFATNVIVRWKRDGVDIRGSLKILQEFMGHDDIASTLYYAHLVRGGLGDPTSVETWEPTNRAKIEEDWFYVEV